jgi:hypothetical protein
MPSFDDVMAAKVEIPKELLQELKFRVDVGVDGDVRAEAHVQLEGIRYTILVDNAESWDCFDVTENEGVETGTPEFFKKMAISGLMCFSTLPWANEEVARGPTLYAHLSYWPQ